MLYINILEWYPLKALRGVDFTKYVITRCSHRKTAKLKTLCLSKHIFSASNFFSINLLHAIFNMSVTYLQSVEKIQ